MVFTDEQKQNNKKDTGSPEVQIGLLTARINSLTGHVKKHVKDHSTRHGLLKLVGQRKRLMDYLRTHGKERYKKMVADLGLRK